MPNIPGRDHFYQPIKRSQLYITKSACLEKIGAIEEIMADLDHAKTLGEKTRELYYNTSIRQLAVLFATKRFNTENLTSVLFLLRDLSMYLYITFTLRAQQATCDN